MTDGPAEKMLPLLPGLGLAILIAAVSQFLSFGHATLDPLVLSILISIVLGNLIGPRPYFQSGIAFSQNLFIPIGIILYGTQMDLRPLQMYGLGRVLHVLLMVFLGLTAIYGMSRALGIPRRIGMLLSAGSAICGASAIMVLSPVIHAEKEETSVSLLSITVVGLTGVIFYPLIQESLSLSEELYALLCGSTLYQVGQVKAAASLLGESAVELAVPVKLLRVGTLLPIAVVYSLLTGREKKKLYVPWFIVGSLVTAAASNLIPPLAAHRAAVAPYVTFFFSIAIAGIGLSIDLEAMIDVGPKPLLAAFLGWGILIILFISGVSVIG